MSDQHLTQQQLILLLDSEWEPGRRHLDTCAICRARLEELENTFSAFVTLHQDTLDAQLPPAAGPRSKLLSGIKSASAPRRMNWWYPAYGVAACLALLGILSAPVDLSMPRTALTPGETRDVSLVDVCRESAAGSGRTVPVSLRRQVFRRYGIRDASPGSYEVDYLITPELGGADSIRNLWPEPYSSVWNAHVKDELEKRLHGLVCSGQVDLGTAQRDLSSDWILAYKKYFHTDQPM